MYNLNSGEVRYRTTVVAVVLLCTVGVLYEPLLEMIGYDKMRFIHFIANLLIVIVSFAVTIQFWFSTKFNRTQREIYLGSNYFLMSLLLIANFSVIDYSLTVTDTNVHRIQLVAVIDCITIFLLPFGMMIAHKSTSRILSARHRIGAAIFPIVAATVIFGTFYFLFFRLGVQLSVELLFMSKIAAVVLAVILHFIVLNDLKKHYDLNTIKMYRTAMLYFFLYYVAFLMYTTIFDVSYLLSYLTEMMAIFVIFRGIYYLSVRAPYASLAKKNEQIKRIAFYDEVSGLPNEEHFKNYMQRFLEEDQDKKLLMVIELERIDFMRAALGTVITNQLVRLFTNRLKATVPLRHYAARLTDSQIAVCVPYEQDEDIERWCKQILAIMEQPFEEKQYTLQLNISIGGACYPLNHNKAHMLRRYANQALIEAHENKRPYEVYKVHWNSQNVEQLEIENDLVSALRNNEIYLEYQPQFDVEKRMITGAEALVRWRHPKRGFISPEQFIPILERSGMIAEVGEYVLRRACIDARNWTLHYGWSLKIGVNLSLAQLLVQDYAKIMRDVLLETKTTPSDVKIEVTESTALHVAQVFPVLRELREIGVQIAIDDFGTGYSSLSYLHEFPVDVIKIDRSFVMEIGENDKAEKVLEGIVGLAKALQLEIIAEGIEYEKQLMYLADSGCDFVQGYLVSRPISMEQLVETAEDINAQVVWKLKNGAE